MQMEIGRRLIYKIFLLLETLSLLATVISPLLWKETIGSMMMTKVEGGMKA